MSGVDISIEMKQIEKSVCSSASLSTRTGYFKDCFSRHEHLAFNNRVGFKN
jgi:hypothetical protein